MTDEGITDYECTDEEIQRIMEEKQCDREQAWGLLQDRAERQIRDMQVKKALEQEEKNREKRQLPYVYETFKKYLCLPDTRRIDLILATAMSKNEKGTPIWCIIVGSSGDGKSETIRPLIHYDNTIKIDNITPNTLASGKQDFKTDKKTGEIIELPNSDLGKKLQNTSTLLLIPDMAVMSSKNTDDKNIIWAQCRNLYDGFIDKMTGNGVVRKYENCHVTLIGCSTNVLRDEFIVHAQLGSREFLWDTGLEENGDYRTKEEIAQKKVEMAWFNEEYEEEMRKDLEEVVQTFLKYHKFKRIPEKEIKPEIKDFITTEAKRLTVLRANVIVDQQHREVINPVVPETATRVVKQLKRLYLSLKSLSDDYSDRRALSIIKTIVDSSGNVVRQMIMQVMKARPTDYLSIKDIQDNTRIGRNSVKAQLEILWNMNVIEKETRFVQVGGYPFTYKDDQGNDKTEIRGTQTREVDHYRWNVENGL